MNRKTRMNYEGPYVRDDEGEYSRKRQKTARSFGNFTDRNKKQTNNKYFGFKHLEGKERTER